MISHPKIFVALPVMDEIDMLQLCLDCIENQSYKNIHIVICVNQPDECWNIPEKIHVCNNNAEILDSLNKKDKGIYTIINKSSIGSGWEGNKKGVGWARKTVMDHISEISNNDDIILSLDADTIFNKEYFSSIENIFAQNTNAVALSNPYYHKLIKSDAEDKAILRYEIYMRNYAINMLIINSPYAFTALGSSISLPVSAYKAIGGLTPKLSGEDFYFLQKLRKYGKIIVYNNEKVFPAARFSDRVFFGTGPAMIKGNMGNWESYPVYHYSLFENIKKTYDCFPELYTNDLKTPMTEFLQTQFSSKDIWLKLRNNNKDAEHFVRACHEKVDGLRILQYLKTEQYQLSKSDEKCLIDNINNVFSHIINYENIDELNFNKCSIDLLNNIRNYLVEVEELLQQKRKII